MNRVTVQKKKKKKEKKRKKGIIISFPVWGNFHPPPNSHERVQNLLPSIRRYLRGGTRYTALSVIISMTKICNDDDDDDLYAGLCL